MLANRITRTSITTSINTGVVGMIAALLKAAAEIFMSITNWGMIRGNPKIAIIAAFCCALAAIAAKKLNTKLRLQPPRKTSPMKGSSFSAGLVKNKLNNKRLNALIISIKRELNSSLANTKC